MKRLFKQLMFIATVLTVGMLICVACTGTTGVQSKPKTFTVSFDLDGGTGNISAQLIQAGNMAKLPDILPQKKNAFFKCWSADGTTIYDFNTGITQNTALKAVYFPIDPKKTRIYDIQGMSHTSPKKGQPVTTVPGVVTAIHYSQGVADGFYMQDQAGDGNPVTSDGIYVYCGKDKVPAELKTGDLVEVSGTVDEYVIKIKDGKKYVDAGFLTITQIKVADSSAVKTVSQDHILPTPVELTEDKLLKEVFKSDLDNLDPANEAIDYYESLEGMRVKVTAPKVVAAPYKKTHFIAPASAQSFSLRGGIMYNSYKSTARVCMYVSGCFKDETKANIPKDPMIGDSYDGDIIGVLTNYDNYQVVPTEKLPKLIKGAIAAEHSTIQFMADKLNIVCYNLENFSKGNTKKSHSSGQLASDRAKAFAEHFVNQLKAPDVICLVEIQDDNSATNDGVVSAKETLQLLIEQIKALSSSLQYAAVNIDPQNNTDGGAPGSNIRCAYLYRTDRLKLVADSDNNTENSSHATEAKISANGMQLVQNPARIGVDNAAFDSTRKSLVAHFEFVAGTPLVGKDFFVINNHLSSKRGDGKIWGSQQPVVRGSEVNRWKQADAVVDFIKTITTVRSNAAVISVGDYNDFWFSETVEKFKKVGMTNVIEKLPENDRYTYVYDGHSQTLDNILVTNNITIGNSDVLHLNAEFSPKTRLSDHDPVFVQLSW